MTDQEDADAQDVEFARGVFSVIKGLVEEYVRAGDLQLQGKSAKEIALEAHALLADDLENAVDFQAILTYQDQLIDEAERYTNDGHEDLALVMYATWFEHWLNDLFLLAAHRRDIVRTEALQIVRQSIHGKTGYIWALIHNEPLSQSIAKTIRDVAERRNTFVHYKWSFAEDFKSEDLKGLVDRARIAVAECRQVEDQIAFQGSREILAEALSIWEEALVAGAEGLSDRIVDLIIENRRKPAQPG